MALRMLRPKVSTLNTSVARLPPKEADPFYSTPEWRATRQRVFRRDGYCCVIPGCGRRAVVCDHVVTRRDGGTDDDGNLRSLCRDHDNLFKEDHLGSRRGGSL